MSDLVFENQPAATAETPVEEPKKQKRKRKPLTDEQKAALVERLKKAREAKKAKDVPIVKEVKGVAKVVLEPEKPKTKAKKARAPPKPKAYREKQLEIEALRAELEIQKLKNDLDDLRRTKKTQSPNLDVIIEEKPTETEVKEKKVVAPKADSVPKLVDTKPKVYRQSLAPKSVWQMF